MSVAYHHIIKTHTSHPSRSDAHCSKVQRRSRHEWKRKRVGSTTRRMRSGVVWMNGTRRRQQRSKDGRLHHAHHRATTAEGA